MTIRDIAVAFGFEVDRNSEKQAENSIKGIKNMATKLLGAIGVVFSIKGMADLAQAAADAEALKSQFTQVFGEMEQEAASKLDAIAGDTGVAVNRMKGSFTQIAAFSKTAGLEQAEALDIANRAMIAVTDSAAFYDRSIEDVTESMRSFLKGNFEQDAALGLSCTETTRNAAANALYGKSFKDLSEAEKQFTLLQMVEDANKASGALGQAARESDTWTNQLGNLKQALTDLKAAAGSTFLKPAVSVLKILTALVQGAAKAIEGLTAENGMLTRATERYHALVKRLQPAIDRMAQTLSKGLNKGIEVARNVADKLGGIENVMRILAIAAAAFLVVMNWSKIISGAKMFMKLISGIGKMFSLANLKILAVVAIIVTLALVVEDFINFLLGNDSVIGTIFDKMGIGADNARQAILNVFSRLKVSLLGLWKAIAGTLSAVWDALRETAAAVFNALAVVIKAAFIFIQSFWSNWGSRILEWFKVLWNSIGGVVYGFLEVITGAANFISSVFAGDWQGAWEAVKQIFIGIWNAISSFIAAVLETIKLLFLMALGAIKAVWEVIWNGIKSFFEMIWNGIVSFLQGVLFVITSIICGAVNGAYGVITSVLTAIHSVFSSIFTSIASFVNSTFSNILDGITGSVASIKDAVINGFNAAIDFIKGLPSQAVQWGKDFMGGLKDGILSGVQGVTDAVKGVGDKIRSFLHFSVPDEGPLTDYESWMPDFMQGMADGIVNNKDTVLDKVRDVAGGISMLMKAAVASAPTAGASTINNTTSSITQNVNIDNTYSGGSAETQKNVSRAMKKSAVDATTQMARGLAYARG